MNEYILDFIAQADFEERVRAVLESYRASLEAIDLRKFNHNIIDPIKLTFDMHAFRLNYAQLIENEIARQRNKTVSNDIGYFHQNLFAHIANCEVPQEGWDVIFYDKSRTFFIEMKNKHNTMNSSAAAKTFMRMQNRILNGNPGYVCALVEVIAKHSQDIPWVVTIDGQKQAGHQNIRRISIDKFYTLVTKDPLAFFKICKQLSITIAKLVSHDFKPQKDTVLDELMQIHPDILTALYKMAFYDYEGFNSL